MGLTHLNPPCVIGGEDSEDHRLRSVPFESPNLIANSRLDPEELVHGHEKHDGAPHWNLDRAGQIGARRASLERHDIDHLLPRLAVLGDQLLEPLDLILLDADEHGRVALTQKAAGRADDGELKASLNQGLG